MPRVTIEPKKKKRGGSNLPAVIGLVAGIHLVMGGGLYALTQTDAGQEFIRLHKIKFLEPEQEKQEEQKAPEPPPPPPQQVEQKVETKTLEAAPQTASAPSVSIGGGGGGPNWAGGKFIGGIEDGPMGAFHAGVLGRVRSCFGEWPGPAQLAEVSLDVTKSGQIASYKLVHGTGVGSDDEKLLEAVRCVQQKGVSAPPDGVGRVVTLRLRPSHGFVSGKG